LIDAFEHMTDVSKMASLLLYYLISATVDEVLIKVDFGSLWYFITVFVTL